jgi:hypothetical protein
MEYRNDGKTLDHLGGGVMDRWNNAGLGLINLTIHEIRKAWIEGTLIEDLKGFKYGKTQFLFMS